MQQKVIAVIFTFLFLAPLTLGLAQDRPVSTSNQASGILSPTPAVPGSSSRQPSEGCKLGTCTGKIPLTQLQYYAAGDEDFRGGMTCSFRINPKLPLFTFHFAGQEDNTFGDVEIATGTSSEAIQTIDNTTDPNAVAPMKARSVLAVVDANFDGYQDLQLLSQCGGTGNCSYDFYLYDPKANQFVHNDFLSNLTTLSFDQAKKQVTTSSNSSVADWQSETYRYDDDGRYILIHREVSTWDRNSGTVTVRSYEVRNGKMELVDSTTKPQ
ncbi:MAG: hypothetical protein WAL60_10690 [Candidatus Sulfotelmatobacter sp.]